MVMQVVFMDALIVMMLLSVDHLLDETCLN
jgi:hypothetical protein